MIYSILDDGIGGMKTCFKCQRELPESEFYKHPRMADGLLGKCKSCTKSDVANRVKVRASDPMWVEAELERHRLKSRRYREDGRAKPLSAENKRTTHDRHREKYPEKSVAHNVLSNAIRDGKITRQPCIVCGDPKSDGHHEDYSKPLDVMWLCRKHHAEHHVQRRREQRLAILQQP